MVKPTTKTNIKLIVLVSVVWLSIAAVVVSSYVYGQVQYSKGVNYGIAQTKSILEK